MRRLREAKWVSWRAVNAGVQSQGNKLKARLQAEGRTFGVYQRTFEDNARWR